MPALRRDNIEICRKIHKKHGKNYYFATKLFPKKIRHATYVLYAFFRIPDEIVDNPLVSDDAEIRKQLVDWKSTWEKIYNGEQINNPVLRATAAVFHTYNIPFEYSESFLDAMIQDTEKKRYANYAELEQYMYGSAAVVGLMMSYVIGFHRKDALRYAEQLGYAMQLTNFLRDIREDYEDRDRIYLPADELAQYGVSEQMIKEQQINDAFKNLMQFQINRSRMLYAQAENGIALLTKEGQFAVRAASVLYAAILDKIEAGDYDVYTKRRGTSFIEKVGLLFRVWRGN